MRTHGQKMFYTEQEFSKAEFEAIERAREQAILNKYGNFSLFETGPLKISNFCPLNTSNVPNNQPI